MIQVIKKEINILPHRSLMPKIGQTGYTISQAIAELVDNSIDVRRDDERLNVEIKISGAEKFVEVSDDGMGMDEQNAASSIKLAHSNKKNKLGEFGLGLKTAATSLGKQFSITTTQAGSDEQYQLAYDEDQWLKTGDWTKHEMSIKKGVGTRMSGTTIKITKLHFKTYGNLPGNIRKDLSTRFAPFIETGAVAIKVNSKWCKPEPILLKTDYHEPDGKDPFRIKLESGNEAWGWRGLLKKGSDKGDYGFRVFRRGRLIMQHAKIGFSPHPEARQIVGELHLDHVPVTHNKREFIQESLLWEEMTKEGGQFWNYMREIVRDARSSMRKTQIDQGIIDKMEVQKDNIMKAIKKIPELKEYAFPDIREKMKSNKDRHDGISVAEMEKRDTRDAAIIEEEPIPTGDGTRKPKKVQTRKTHFIWVNGKKFKVKHDFINMKTEDVLKDKSVDEEEGIHVYTNIDFPAFANTKDHVFYGVWNIAEAIAEIMVERNRKPVGETAKIRDLILKRSAQITRELDDLERDKKSADKLKREYEEKMQKIKEIENKHATS